MYLAAFSVNWFGLATPLVSVAIAWGLYSHFTRKVRR